MTADISNVAKMRTFLLSPDTGQVFACWIDAGDYSKRVRGNSPLFARSVRSAMPCWPFTSPVRVVRATFVPID
jgi:hypothetical protein